MRRWLVALALSAIVAEPAFAGPWGLDCASGQYLSHDPATGGGVKCVDAPAVVGSGVPAGAIVLTLSAACPVGYVEETALAGKFPLGTSVAAANVGTTGGQDTITEVVTHTHPVTDPGHAHAQQRHVTATGALTGITTAPDTSSSSPGAMGPATASATTGVTVGAPAGAVASIDNRPAFTRVLFCRRT